MSSGKVHAQASLILSGGFFLGTFTTGNVADIEYSMGALLGIVLTPDLDVDAGSEVDKYIKRRFGHIPYWIWERCWHFYRRSVKHGSELSHFPVVGTFFRLAYLFFFAFILPYAVLDIFFPVNWEVELSWWIGLVANHWRIVVGLASSDFHHYVMDIATVNGRFNLESLLRRKTNFKRRSI